MWPLALEAPTAPSQRRRGGLPMGTRVMGRLRWGALGAQRRPRGSMRLNPDLPGGRVGVGGLLAREKSGGKWRAWRG